MPPAGPTAPRPRTGRATGSRSRGQKTVKKIKRAEARPTLVWLGAEKLKELAGRLNTEFGPGTVSIIQAGLLVQPEKLVALALYLRDKNPIKYDYLASLQSVHYEDLSSRSTTRSTARSIRGR